MTFQIQVKYLAAACLTLGLLSGCQSISTTTVSPPVAVGQIPSKQFSLEGKIGIKAPKQSGSAFYSWQQDQDQFSIQLNGILGIGKTIIEGKPGQVTLDSSKTGLISAGSPEELLERATGWYAPITYIVDWVRAQPATTNAELERDEHQRLIKINEADWNVDLSYADQDSLPNKLIMRQSLSDGEEIKITLLIQKR
ncbi:lipoprotein insertase outer membrane protein LolB [Acinetobacter rudis]|uniref:Outer-membrane lipoprotein LolB n=1 Tax=Acinetobacter rudis TaxID=632955 RepID=A0AAW8J640_9GAMM|nr:lipoprotein insertase outer membrane protein LolB [Acinetobacter rudis]MDQ8934593.1 lipoprotein insertase outer membrane protein LolB [Acinetobacter rudis]MDQ8951640.1 lipoprotein insertase outer membrane protein LolB [Acinetobacter rudis]MDQ9016837.1 lipoprotein insertase outer membrane protein LolB [Acinetobacter rudis]